jgi:hypothetical protein
LVHTAANQDGAKGKALAAARGDFAHPDCAAAAVATILMMEEVEATNE